MATKKKNPRRRKSPPRKLAAPNSPQTLPVVETNLGEDSDGNTPPAAKAFPVIGIGASAGGLAAFEAFFSAMPGDDLPGMAFVLVQHLAPDHVSILSDLIKRYTRMPVHEVENGIEIEANSIYVIPPNRDMALVNGTLQLLEPVTARGLRLSVDFFFRSLAEDQHERAIGIVLSGSGSDGALGTRAIKGEGGMVMVQDPATAEYDGMPRSAIATDMVDSVLAPAKMPEQLLAYVKHAFRGRSRPAAPVRDNREPLNKICALLRFRTGHDFSQYKENTLTRRIERRMALHQIEHMTDYLRYAQRDPEEIDGLFRDLLIGVTSFFRDPEAFLVLQNRVLPRLIADKPPPLPLRAWVCACSTGEEAYSLAILLAEQLEAMSQSQRREVQIFATDVDKLAVERARAGVFPPSIAVDVTPERLERFFMQDPHGSYHIQKAIRDRIIFSEQDVTRDPPFSKLDLVMCRNLLIYMKPELQRRVISLFHYALNPKGILFLGPSENAGEVAGAFDVIERKWKIYAHKPTLADAHPLSLGDFISPLSRRRSGAHPLDKTTANSAKMDYRTLAEQSLLRHHGSSGVLVDGHGNVVYIHGRTGKFLEPAPGEPRANLLSMARQGLRRDLATALHQAQARGEAVQRRGLRVQTNGDSALVNLAVEPVVAESGAIAVVELFLVVFEEAPAEQTERLPEESGAAPADIDARIGVLEKELQAKDEYLQTALEEMETSNEELQSTNEELESVNEELQSTNEELETSKEELQSVNEELATVNAELQSKVNELARANNDLNNLLAGTGVGTLFVDHGLRIMRFTPHTAAVINLIAADVGRPVGHIASNLVGYDRLVQDIQAVLDNLMPREAEVQSKNGNWYLMSIRPYRTQENRIEGAVITFVEITQRKRLEQEMHRARRFAEDIVDTVREPLIVLNESLSVVSANRSFYREFRVAPQETVGRLIYQLGNGQWDIPELRRVLENILPERSTLEEFTVSHEFEHLGRRTMRLNARRVQGEGSGELILLAIEIAAKEPAPGSDDGVGA